MSGVMLAESDTAAHEETTPPSSPENWTPKGHLFVRDWTHWIPHFRVTFNHHFPLYQMDLNAPLFLFFLSFSTLPLLSISS